MACSNVYHRNWKFVSEIQFESVICGHHNYKSRWTPSLGEKTLPAMRIIVGRPGSMMNMLLGTYMEAGNQEELVEHVPV